MDEQSTTASDLVRAYRRRTLDDGARARIEARLAASIAAPAPVVGPAPPSRSRILLAGVVALAAAAALVLALRRWGESSIERPAPSDRGQAPYEHREDADPQPVLDSDPAPAAAVDTGAEVVATTSSAPVAAPPATSRPAPRSPGKTDATVTTGEDTSLSAELAIVRRVRAALERDDATAALAAIAEHERRFATGQLVEERKSLRVEALCRAGKPAQARAEATTFLREHPGSAHADRVRAACPR